MPGIPKNTAAFMRGVSPDNDPIPGTFATRFNVFSALEAPVLDFQSVRDCLISWVSDVSSAPGSSIVFSAGTLVNIALVLSELNGSELVSGLEVLPLPDVLSRFVASVSTRVKGSFLELVYIDPMINKLLSVASALLHSGNIEVLNFLILPDDSPASMISPAYAIYHRLVICGNTDLTATDVYLALTGYSKQRLALERIVQNLSVEVLPSHDGLSETTYVERLMLSLGLFLLYGSSLPTVDLSVKKRLLSRIPILLASVSDINSLVFFDSVVAHLQNVPYKGVLPIRLLGNVVLPGSGSPDQYELFPVSAIILDYVVNPDVVSTSWGREVLPPDHLNRHLPGENRWNPRLRELVDTVT